MAYLGDNTSKPHATEGRVHVQLSVEPLEATMNLLLKHSGPQFHAESFIYSWKFPETARGPIPNIPLPQNKLNSWLHAVIFEVDLLLLKLASAQ